MTVKLTYRSLAGSLALSALFATMIAGCGPSGSDSGSSTGTTGTEPTKSNDTSNTSSSNTADPNKINIGLVASITGELKPWGMDSQNGALLAVDEINKAGGINGKQINLMIEDSGSSPEQGKTAAERLITHGAIAIVGEVASGITVQIANAAKAQKVPVIAVGATRTDLPGIGDWVYRVCYTDDLQGPVMANFAYDYLGLRNIAIMTDVKQPYSTYLSKTFKETYLHLGGKIVAEESYEGGQTQFGGQLTNIKGKNPDGMFLSGYFTEVGPIVRQAAEQGIKAKFMGGDGWDSSEILTSGGDAILGGYFCNHYNNKEDRKEVKDFLGRWKAKYNQEPGTTMAALGYDAIGLVADSLKRAKSASSADLREAIGNTEAFHGVSGSITLKGMHGNPDKRALVVRLTKEGQVFEKAYEVKDVKK